MKFDEKDLLLAQKEGIISADVFTKLIDFLSGLQKDKQSKQTPATSSESYTKVKFTLENFFYYFGAFVIIDTIRACRYVCSFSYLFYPFYSCRKFFVEEKQNDSGRVIVCLCR